MNRRTGAILFALAALLLLATPTWPDFRVPAPLPPARSALRAEPVRFHAEQPAANRAGALEFLGGWALTSDDPRFGAISAIHVEGGMALALSDAGDLLRFALPETAGFGAVDVARLAEGPWPVRRKADRDAEGLMVSGGEAWVLWENRREVWRYGRDWRARSGSRPMAMRRFGRNAGAEAIVRLADGRFLILSETASGQPGLYRGLLFGGDPAVPHTPNAPLLYRPPEGFRATDAALLPGGRLLVLNRRLNISEGLGAALTLIDPATIRPGATIEGREIARLEWPLALDNMEALSVTREGGRTILWIASDDNFNPLQRTLLLRFALRL